MNSMQSIAPILAGLDSTGSSDPMGSSAAASGAFAQVLQAVMEQDGNSGTSESNGTKDGANLGLLLASMLQNGEESDDTMMLMIAAMADQKRHSGSGAINSPQSDSQGSTANHAANSGRPAQSYSVPRPTFAANTHAARAYRSVIDRFDVENNGRYSVNQQGKGDTYCNLFVTDVTNAMRATVPHFIDKDTGEPRSGKGPNVVELSANDMNNWLHRYGARYGWRETTAETAQAYANAGRPAITSWKNPSGHGHIQMISPSGDGGYDAQRGVTIAQAGRKLVSYGYINQIFGQKALQQVEYYVHD